MKLRTKRRASRVDDKALKARVTELFEEGYSNAVIAETVGVPTATLQKLRKEWGLLREVTSGNRWTDEEDQQIITLRAKGKTGAEIANVLGRSYGAYASRLKVLKAEGRIKNFVRKGGAAVTTAELEAAGVDHNMLAKLKRVRISGGSIDRDFSLRDMVRMFKAQRGLCYYTQLPLTAGKGFESTNLSLDRLDSTKNYTYDNTVMCCAQVNKMKGTLTLEEFDWWVDRLVEGRG